MGRSSLSLPAIAQRMAHGATAQAAPPAAPRPQAKHGAPAAAPRAAGQVRIIGGQWKRRLLPVASGKGVPDGLRPTPDRVRETLFNWLGQDLHGWRCLDACAGTGALGLEAASRGAAQVLLVEQHATLVTQLRRIVDQLQAASTVQVRQGDALTALRDAARQQPGGLDLVLFDPPFSADWYEAALQTAHAAVKPNGYFYLEAARAWSEADLTALGWQRWRYLKAGAVHAHLLRPLPAAAQDRPTPLETDA